MKSSQILGPAGAGHFARIAQVATLSAATFFLVARFAALHLVGAGHQAAAGLGFVEAFFWVQEFTYGLALFSFGLFAMQTHTQLAGHSGRPFRLSRQQVFAGLCIPGVAFFRTCQVLDELLFLAGKGKERWAVRLPVAYFFAALFGSVGYMALATLGVALTGVPLGVDALFADTLICMAHVLFALMNLHLLRVLSFEARAWGPLGHPALQTATLFGHVAGVTKEQIT